MIDLDSLPPTMTTKRFRREPVLKDTEIHAIKKLLANGSRVSDLAQQFGVSTTMISKIKTEGY